ncbi:metal-dependent hydrolase [Tepidimicrobium xylanilyticum]|uniref:Inner membrane protein n=1 Tax=Tepidimicrobium xylanilyticum TaxID=1123352 RepID=A0A1H3C1T0_9FIRM|nr:metal-dependent hydrolase [Tepidimicrobium xylanilyticum]GMG97325.1 membrane protein [Tepidimicrobium xylanilyticum]SDX48117.1 inner membrane protein [Tepidimicrobium xylanilyticum]
MTGQTHVAIGIATALTLSMEQPIENKLIIILASTIGALAPDLDHPRGKLNQKLLLINSGLYRTLFYISLGFFLSYVYTVTGEKLLMLLGRMAFLVGISTHRGFTHSILGFLISGSLVKSGATEYGLPSIYTGFIIGYLCHLIADFFTPMGIKLFFPLGTNVTAPITIKTNSKIEKIIFLIISFYSISLLIKCVYI